MPPILRTALLVTAKDLRQRLRDRSAWLVGIAAPLLLAAVLGQVIGGFTSSVSAPIRLGHLASGTGPAGRALVDVMLPQAVDEVGGSVTAFADRSGATRALAADDVDAVIVVPPRLDEDIRRFRSVTVEILLPADGGQVAALVAEGIVQVWAAEVDVRVAAVLAAVGVGVSPEAATERIDQLPPNGLLRTVEVASADRVLDGSTQVSAGLAVFFLFFTVQLGVVGLVEERQSGTLDRLLVAPVPGGGILLGKILTSVVIGFGATVVLLTATTQFLGATWGPIGPVLLLVAAAVAAAVSLVVVVSGFATSADAATNAQGVIAIVLGMLGGAFFPVATRAGWLATLSDLTPHGLFLTAIGDLQVPGAGIADIGPQLAGLLGFAAAVSVGAGRFVRIGAAR